jgi:tetratricopeptide (TPR) repeat protein
MEKAQSHWDYSKIVDAFAALGSYKDSQALAEKAKEIYSEGEYQKAVSKIENATTEKQFQTVINILQGIGVYKDSLALIARCEDTIKALFAEEKYKTAIDKLENAITVQDFLGGIQLLEDIGDYKNAIALKAEHKERWASRQENANKVWAD